MLLAAAIGDQQRFDTIWDWTKDNLQRPDGLHLVPLARRPRGGPAGGVRRRPGRRRARCWSRPAASTAPSYAQEALELGEAILAERDRRRSRATPVLVAGPWARKDADHGQPELLLARHVRGAAATRPATARWGSLAASSRVGHDLLMPGPGGLPPDWAQLEGGKPVPIGAAEQPAASAGCSASTRCARSSGWPRTRTRPGGGSPPGRGPRSRGRTPADIPVEHDLSGKPAGSTQHPVALVAAAGAADAAGDTTAARR